MKTGRIVVTTFLLVLVNSFGFGFQSDSLDTKTIPIEIEFSQKEQLTTFDKYFGYAKDLLTPLIALIALWIGYPLLRKKLTENHITKVLDGIQNTNSEVQKFNQKLIDKYLPLTYGNDPLGERDIKAALNDVSDGFYLSQTASSDVTTLMFYLKSTVQGTLRHYDPTKAFLTTRSFLGLVINTLDLVNFYSTQVVQIPKSAKTITKNLINKKVRKYITNPGIVKYKYFDIGVIDDPNSAHFSIFCGNVNRTSNPLIMRAAFQIHWNPNAIATLLFVNELYGPSLLEMPSNDSLFGSEKLTLFLIGFNIKNQLSSEENAPTKIVELVYSNPDDVHHFVSPKTFTLGKLKSKFSDTWIPESSFDLNEIIKMNKNGVESLILTFGKEYLKKKFTSNKKIIEKKLSKETESNKR